MNKNDEQHLTKNLLSARNCVRYSYPRSHLMSQSFSEGGAIVSPLKSKYSLVSGASSILESSGELRKIRTWNLVGWGVFLHNLLGKRAASNG